jgi:DNA end-binding protein Ku
MPARSIFNGRLNLDGAIIPVKLYTAVEPGRVAFRLLHASDGVPIRQRMVNPRTGEEVPHEAARKALPLASAMVILREEELAELDPEPSRDIEFLRFVAPETLDQPWYERPYWVGPAGTAEETRDYFAFVRALTEADKLGIVRWTMRKKSYHGALRAFGEHLALITLRSPDELIPTDKLPELSWPTPSEQELNMARQLIALLEGEPDLEQFRDRYAEQVAELAAAKATGRPPEPPEHKPTRPAAPSLTDALAASIARLEERRVA